jgi:hypothetical protein
MNTEEAQIKNLLWLSRFRRYWVKRGRIDNSQIGVRIFPAKIRYWIRDKKRNLKTDVHIYADGKVYLVESAWLNAEDHYTQFDSHFQKYRVTKKRHSLRIRGGTYKEPENKMGGPYKLDIRPLKNSPN